MSEAAGPVDRQDASRTPLPIDRVQVSVFSTPLTDQVPMSFGRLEARQFCLVRISACGVEGIGESWINYPPWAPAERMASLCQGIAPRLIGLDATDPAGIQARLSETLLPIGRQAGALGAMWQGLSGVDLALWDLAARAAGVPVATLLTGASSTRTRIPAYASGVGPTDVERCCERAVAQGLSAVKTKIGFGQDRDRITLAAARSGIGPNRALFADANQAWDLESAIAMLPLLHEYDVDWLEEPLAGDRRHDLERLAAAGSPDIATGENLYGADQFEQYAASPAVRILQPDLAKAGGFTVARRVMAAASATTTAVAPHCYSSAMGLAAAAHLGAAYPQIGWLELDIRDNPLRTDLLCEPLRLVDGAMEIPAGPGLGVEIDPAAVRRFRTHHEEITSS